MPYHQYIYGLKIVTMEPTYVIILLSYLHKSSHHSTEEYSVETHTLECFHGDDLSEKNTFYFFYAPLLIERRLSSAYETSITDR